MRSLQGIIPILQRCGVDERNLQMREWAMLTVRNLCAGNAENQAFIESIERQPREVVNPDVHASMGLEVAVDPVTGRLKVKR